MPDSDLGTARARIKIDGDSRGADSATRAVEGFQRALEFIAGHIGSFTAAMGKVDQELKNANREFDSATRAANKYDRAIDSINAQTIKMSRSTNQWSSSLNDLHERIRLVNQAAERYAVPGLQMARVTAETIRGMKQGRNGVLSFASALNRAGVASTAFTVIQSRFFGMGKALAQAPAWQQSIARTANSFRLFTLAGLTFTKLAGPLTAGFSRLVRGAEGADFAIKGFTDSINNVVGPVRRFLGDLDRIPAGMFQVAGGMALMQNAVRNLSNRFGLLRAAMGGAATTTLGKVFKFFFLPTILLSDVAIQALYKSLIFLSNTMAGLWSGVKQLAGGFLALPGAIASIGAAAGPLIVIVKTLKDNFKDLLKAVSENDPEKFAEAMRKIPPYLRPLAQSVANAVQPLKDLQNVLTATFVSGGLDRQVTALVNTWLPAISSGADQVANSWKILTNAFAQFLGEAQTISDVNAIFMHTSQILNTIASSIQPVLDGFRDIAAVGSTFIRNLVEDYLPGVADRFKDWAANARATGKAMGWMEASVHAVKELYIGFDNAVRGLWKLLTLFQTQSGDNFLDRFANSMRKFNQWVDQSRVSGELKKIADAVKNIGDNKIREFIDLWKQIYPAIHDVFTILNQIGQAFNAVLLPVIHALVPLVVSLVQGFASIGGGTIIGTILGLTNAFKLLGFVLGPIRNVIQFIFGALTVRAGVTNVLVGLASTLERFGPIGQKASAGILSIGDSIAGFAQKATIAAAAGFAFYELMTTGAQEMRASGKAIADAAKYSTEQIGEIRKAFYQDNGTTGPTVISTLTRTVENDMSNLQNVVDKAPSVTSKFTDFIKQGLGNVGAAGIAVSLFRGTSDELQNLQNKSNDAKSVLSATNDAMKQLGITSSDLAKYVYGSNDAFAQFEGILSRAGQTGAIQYWSQLRTQFVELQREMEAAGPGAVMLANGIDKIGQSGGDAAKKLDGLKLALQGLGLLKEDQYEAALNFAKAIDNLGDAAANAVDKSQPLKDLLDPNTGILNTAAGANANNLYNAVQPIAEAFLRAAASGQDLSAFIPKMQANLEALRQSFGLSKDAFDKFIQGLGIDPPTVSLLVQAKDDHVEQGIIAILAKAQQSVANQQPIEIPVGVDAPTIQKQLNDLFANPNAVGIHGNNIILQPGIDQAALDKLRQYLADKYGIQMQGGPPVPPQVAASVPVTPTAPAAPPVVPAPGEKPQPKDMQPPKPAAGPTLTQPKLPPGLPAPIYPPGYQPPGTKNGGTGQAPPPQLPPGTQFPPGMQPSPAQIAAGQALAPVDVPTPAPPMAPPPPPPPINTPPQAAPAPQAGPAGTQNVNIPVTITGLDQFDQLQDKFKGLQDSLAKNIAAWAEWQAGVTGIMAQVLAAVDSVMQATLQKLADAALKTKASGQAFAQGFADGIKNPASLQRIAEAAALAAKTAADYMPHSPARKGPLSGQGWSGHAGGAFSGDFATGILGGQAAVGQAAAKVAGKARGALAPETPYGNFGFKFKGDGLNRIRNNLQFLANGINLFKNVADNLFTLGGMFVNNPFAARNTSGGLSTNQRQIAGGFGAGAAGLFGNKNPSQQEIAAAIAGEAAKRGYDRNTAIAVIAAAMQESSLNTNQVNASGHEGLFQTSADKGVGLNAGNQIAWMFNQLDQLGGPKAGGLTSDPLDWIAQNIEKGGYGGAALSQHAQAAANLYDKAAASGAAIGAGPWAGAPLAANPSSAARRLPAANTVEDAINAIGGLPTLYPTSGQNAYQLPPWMQQLAQAFNLTASTYANGGSLHQMGFAADFNGNPADLERFAQFISGNLASQTLQLIYQGATGNKYGIAAGQAVGPGTSQPGYYANDFGGHTDHVHWATDVAPILANANAGAMPWAAGNMPVQGQGYGSQNPILPPGTQPGTDIAGRPYIPLPGQTPFQQSQQYQAGFQQIGAHDQQNSVQNQTQQIFGTIQTGISGAANVASDVISTIQAGVDAWGATKYIADQMVRGISNTEDIYNMIDQFQKYITFAAKIAQTTGDVLSSIGSVVGAGASADPTGGAGGAAAAIQGASQIAQLISAALSTVNAAIDFGQEAWRVFGSYFGDFLGWLTGGNTNLMGNVHFLLDQNTKQLLAYSSDNPQLKSEHSLIGQQTQPNANNQPIGQLNYFAGPGEDPRTGVRNMMYQVKASQMAGAISQ